MIRGGMGSDFFFMTIWGTALLFAMGFGYVVCSIAAKQEKALKTLGFAVGGFIIAVSFVLILGKALWVSGICPKQCGMMGAKGSRMGMMHQGGSGKEMGKGMGMVCPPGEMGKGMPMDPSAMPREQDK